MCTLSIQISQRFDFNEVCFVEGEITTHQCSKWSLWFSCIRLEETISGSGILSEHHQPGEEDFPLELIFPLEVSWKTISFPGSCSFGTADFTLLHVLLQYYTESTMQLHLHQLYWLYLTVQTSNGWRVWSLTASLWWNAVTSFSYIFFFLLGTNKLYCFINEVFKLFPMLRVSTKNPMAEDQFKITEESCPRLVILVRAAASWPGFSMISSFLSWNAVVCFSWQHVTRLGCQAGMISEF